jgi:D-glycero-D-manno-heptose 1,7-bisphosphate phosphatase
MIGDALDESGMWCQMLNKNLPASERPALFLDRDGVIVEEVTYLHRSIDVVPIQGAAGVIATANRIGLAVIMVTNQAGIARGYYGWPEFHKVQETILANLADSGAAIDAVFACPYHPTAKGAYFHASHPARKPAPGMLFRAAEMLRLNLRESWIAGDNRTDLLAGKAAGLRGGVLVLTGHGSAYRKSAESMRTRRFEVLIADSIRDLPAVVPIFARSRPR